jgi:hypothetical protein
MRHSHHLGAAEIVGPRQLEPSLPQRAVHTIPPGVAHTVAVVAHAACVALVEARVQRALGAQKAMRPLVACALDASELRATLTYWEECPPSEVDLAERLSSVAISAYAGRRARHRTTPRARANASSSRAAPSAHAPMPGGRERMRARPPRATRSREGPSPCGRSPSPARATWCTYGKERPPSRVNLAERLSQPRRETKSTSPRD